MFLSVASYSLQQMNIQFSFFLFFIFFNYRKHLKNCADGTLCIHGEAITITILNILNIFESIRFRKRFVTKIT